MKPIGGRIISNTEILGMDPLARAKAHTHNSRVYANRAAVLALLAVLCAVTSIVLVMTS